MGMSRTSLFRKTKAITGKNINEYITMVKLKKAASLIKDENYTIFLDINMPEMNGWEFLNEIKSFVSPQNTTIYLLTSSINKLDKEKATHFPIINQYLSKPICKEILKKIKEENKL